MFLKKALRYRWFQALVLGGVSLLIGTCAVFAPWFARAVEQTVMTEALSGQKLTAAWQLESRAPVLTQVGLNDSGDHLVEELSGGEQQRVAVARGIAQQGKVILADESTSELDSNNRERVLDLLRTQADRGAAVIIATHDPTVAETADGHALMDEGRLTWVRRL
ncbi:MULTISPECIES: ATP-binding cassette domain-containing protein [unclassified Kribbella]|uniref:ATP-binding cassette domain-containing protein n=1 Tax=unclassified Kribbella TaxID=2644121 RepID=UPI003077B08C